MRKLLLISLLVYLSKNLDAMHTEEFPVISSDETHQQDGVFKSAYQYVVATQERELVLATDGSLYWIEDINYEEERKSAVSANEWTFNGIIPLKPTLLLVLDFNQYHRVREVRINQKDGVALVNITENDVPDQYKDWEILYIDDLRFTLILGECTAVGTAQRTGYLQESIPTLVELACEKSRILRSEASLSKVTLARNRVVESWHDFQSD